MSLIRNEQLKLTATYLNGIAIAVFAVGGFAPIVASLSSAMPTVSAPRSIFAIVVICIAISAALHLLARQLLKGLIS